MEKVLPYTPPVAHRDLLPPLTGRLVKVEENVYTDASRILGVLINEKNPKLVCVHRQASNGDILETTIKGNIKRIANKISRAKTTSGRAIDLFPLSERILSRIKSIFKR